MFNTFFLNAVDKDQETPLHFKTATTEKTEECISSETIDIALSFAKYLQVRRL